MTTYNEYLNALKVVNAYRREENERTRMIQDLESNFPKGTLVFSKLNEGIKGVVQDYTFWKDKPQLICYRHDPDSVPKNTVRILGQNAIVDKHIVREVPDDIQAVLDKKGTNGGAKETSDSILETLKTYIDRFPVGETLFRRIDKKIIGVVRKYYVSNGKIVMILDRGGKIVIEYPEEFEFIYERFNSRSWNM